MLRTLSTLVIISVFTIPAHADTFTTFTVNNATFLGGGTGMGSVTIDVTSGMYTAVNFTYSDPFANVLFNTIASQTTFGQQDYFTVQDNLGDSLLFDLPVASLVGYAGGAICSNAAPCSTAVSRVSVTGQKSLPLLTGTLTPAATVPPVPEPSSLLLLGTGVIGLVGAVRRRYLKAPR